MKAPKKDLQLIVWDDAQFDQNGNWQGPARTHSVGYRLKDVKRCARLAQSWSANQGYAEVLTVPIGMLVRVMELGEVDPAEYDDVISPEVLGALTEGPGRIGG